MPDERVLIVAPTGADARNIRAVLARPGLNPVICPNVSAVAIEMEHGCGAILLTEEALDYERHEDLVNALERQPSWSDIPVVFIVSGVNRPAAESEAVRLIRPRSNFTLVERPLRQETLISTVDSALRARRRQYEVRDLLGERDNLLATLEQRVADRTAELQELNTELESFSYSVSHDLRGPLRAVESYARILCEEFSEGLPDQARHYLQRIARNAEKMDRLMRDVLTFSRLARTQIELEPIDLDRLVAEVIEDYPNLAAAQNITVSTPLGWVMGHVPSLMQCFSNLLQNAVKFSSEQRPAIIEVFSEARDTRVRVSVQDNGIGIDPTQHARIFGLFERASPSSVPGTGIGLAIVKKAVERMGGTVGVDSAPGQGSRFWIELPSAQMEAATKAS